jgi:hypothetical protein
VARSPRISASADGPSGGVRTFLSQLPGFESFASLAMRNEQLNMYICGPGHKTTLHYDREGNTNLHFCLAGKKRIVYMDHDQKAALQKRMIISGCVFEPERRADPEYLSQFAQIRACDITLVAGEMLYMPQRS